MLTCPHCGEPIDLNVDAGGGADQEYIEDCYVCCRPIRFRIIQDPTTGEFEVHASAEV